MVLLSKYYSSTELKSGPKLSESAVIPQACRVVVWKPQRVAFRGVYVNLCPNGGLTEAGEKIAEMSVILGQVTRLCGFAGCG